MMNKNTYNLLFLLWGSLLFSCDLKDNEVVPEQAFVRIYESGEFGRDYVPMDVQPLSGGGYLILAGATATDSDFMALYLLKTDEQGKVKWEHMSERYVNPVSELMASQDGALPGAFTFVVMDKQQLEAHLIQVNPEAEGEPELVSKAFFEGAGYPLAAGPVSGGYSLLHWNRNNKSNMQLSRIRGTEVMWTKKYDIYEDVEAMVMAHLTRQRLPLVPFRTGELPGGQLYFNGYNNFTIALTFVNGHNGEQTGVVNGTRYASAISQLEPLQNGKFAVSRYAESGENIYAPAADFSAGGIASVKDLAGNQLPELTPFAKVKIRQEMAGSEPVTFYLSDTRNGQMVLFAYDAGGILLGTKYLGSGNRFESGSMRITADGGMVIAGRAFVAGRFPRLCLFKLSPEEISTLTGK